MVEQSRSRGRAEAWRPWIAAGRRPALAWPQSLRDFARRAAQRVRETGQPFRFNPMSSRDRRLIHLELNGAAGVRTMSEGSGDHRQLVIYPANNTNKR